MITHIGRGAAVAALVALVAVGCGDDDSDDAAGSGGAGLAAGRSEDVSAYCSAQLALETAPPPDIDFASATPEEQAAAAKQYANETVRPLADDVIAAAPAELADVMGVQDEALTQLQADGDFTVFEQPDVVAAQAENHAFDVENCGWADVPVTATEYAFDGVPDRLDAGVVSFDFTNDGAQVHELLLFRRNDGVTDSIEDLLALPEDEAMTKLTMLGEPAFAPPGGGSYTVADLEPGEYVAVCMIPTGMTSTDGPPPDGPPHAMQGMVAEFTVT